MGYPVRGTDIGMDRKWTGKEPLDFSIQQVHPGLAVEIRDHRPGRSDGEPIMCGWIDAGYNCGALSTGALVLPTRKAWVSGLATSTPHLPGFSSQYGGTSPLLRGTPGVGTALQECNRSALPQPSTGQGAVVLPLPAPFFSLSMVEKAVNSIVDGQ